MTNKKLAGTFILNRDQPIHRWYSYIEGYSSALVEAELDALQDRSIKTIYDPFGGTGTTLLCASARDIVPYYSETNPFMNHVVRTKINDVMAIVADEQMISEIEDFKKMILTYDELTGKSSWDGFEKYYDEDVLNDVTAIKALIDQMPESAVKRILMLALSAILVDVSKMIRRGDLRFAKASEKNKDRMNSVRDVFVSKLEDMVADIKQYGHTVRQQVIPLAEDSREITQTDLVDCVITSPPYLNGTNYIRNTKLELKLNDYVNIENDLCQFHSRGIVAGINNVSKRNGIVPCLPQVESYIEQLNLVSYDRRIPVMVQTYFYNMKQVFEKLREIMRDGAVFIMDIGDSQFAGVHIPTHDILVQLCEACGFSLYDEEILRRRHSKNGMELTQRVLRFELSK